VTVVPSIFPEAFGMVAAEAAAAGSLPLVARHSGLAEIADGLSAEYPAEFEGLTSFETNDAHDLAAKLDRLRELSESDRQRLREAGRAAVEANWSWEQVSARLLQPFTN
jgi:glycosyltransferase involved in cell wall biosynthesis